MEQKAEMTSEDIEKIRRFAGEFWSVPENLELVQEQCAKSTLGEFASRGTRRVSPKMVVGVCRKPTERAEEPAVKVSTGTTGTGTPNDAKATKQRAVATSDKRPDARKKYDSLSNEGKKALKQNAALHACKKENLHMNIEDIGILFGLPEKSLNRDPYKSIIKRGRDKARQERQR